MTDKTAEALKLAEEALSELMDLMDGVREGDYKPDSFTNQPAEEALAAIRDALAEQSKCACDSPAWCTKYKKCNREMLGLPKAEPVKQEPVMDYEHICALRESEQIQAGDSYFFVRPENDTPTSRKMFFQGFERGFHKGLKYAAQVSAKREWVELTDDELKAALEVHQVGLSIRIGRIAIAAFKEKNK